MQLEMFVMNLALATGVVAVAMGYLRGATRDVLRSLCPTGSSAEFWLRSADVMAYSGALILVLTFSDFADRNVLDVLRWTLILSLAGLFLAVWVTLGRVREELKLLRSINPPPEKI